MKTINLKNTMNFVLKVAPCFILMHFCLSQSYYLIRHITQVFTLIYAIYILLKNNAFTSIFLILGNITFSLFSNIGIQNEITYLQIFQMLVIYLFCFYLNNQNLNFKKAINVKNNIINKDYITGLYNKRYLDKIMFEEFLCNEVNSYMIAIGIDDFDILTLNYGYESSEIILKKVAKIINKKIKNKGFCCRVFGEKFIIVIESNKKININKFALEIKELIESFNFYINNKNISVCVNIAITSSMNFVNYEDYFNYTIAALENSKLNFQEKMIFSKRAN